MRHRYKISIDTQDRILKFVQIATEQADKEILLTNKDKSFIVNGKSLLGAMYTVEWDSVYCDSNEEIYHLIKDFIID